MSSCTTFCYVPLPEWARVLRRPLRVAVLLRRSKDDPDTKSLQVQRDAIFGWLNTAMPEGSWTCDVRLAEHGGDVYEQIVSAWRGNGQHKLLRRVMARLSEYDVVLVYRMDRFGRQPHAVFTALEQMREAGVRLYSVYERVDTADPSQNFEKGLFILLAQRGSDETSARIKANKERAKQKGGWRGGSITYGFRKAMAAGPDGTLVPVLDVNGYKTLEHDPAKVKHLIDTIDLIVDGGWSVAAAVRRLNDLGVQSPRGFRVLADGTRERIDWTATGLKRILMNPALMGFDVVGTGDERFQVLEVDDKPHRPNPPIVSDTRWTQLQRSMRSPDRKRRRAQEALLAGLVFCDALRHDGLRCGQRLYGPGTVTSNNASYACRVTNNLGRNDGRRCTGNAISAKNLERLVELTVRGIASNPAWQAALQTAYAQARAAAAATTADVGIQLADLERRMTERRREKDKARSSLRRAQLEREIDELDGQIADLEAARAVPAAVAAAEVDFGSRWELMTQQERRALITDLVERIEVSSAGPASRTQGRAFDPSRVKIVLRHVGTLHITEPVDLTAGRQVSCPECTAEFPTPAALGVHRRHKHGVVGATSRRPVGQPTVYSCPELDCGRQTTSAGGMKRHMIAAHGQRETLLCPHGCPKVFATTLDLASHVHHTHDRAANVDTAPMVCDQCSKVLRGGHGLRIHQGRAHAAA